MTAVLVDDNQRSGRRFSFMTPRSPFEGRRRGRSENESPSRGGEASVTRTARVRRRRLALSALRQKEEISGQQYDSARADADSAVPSSMPPSAGLAAQAKVAKQADLDYARLQLTHGPRARHGDRLPQNVEVRRNVLIGQPPGVVRRTPWCNEPRLCDKETGGRTTGQKRPEVDFTEVDSIAAATTRDFRASPTTRRAILRRSFRVPVKIVFTDLRPGGCSRMSVTRSWLDGPGADREPARHDQVRTRKWIIDHRHHSR